MGNCTGNCISHVIDGIAPTLHQNLQDLANTNTANVKQSGVATYNGHELPTSAVHDDLPPAFEKHRVIKVYDGDTLTLENNQRVRLIGIDTPEIKESQEFSVEAKQYLSDCCLDKNIILSYEDVDERQDHYGRLVAWVWIEVGNGFLNVNEGLLALGLANFYNPGKTPFHNQNQMLAIQKKARENRRGIWKGFRNCQVLRTRNGRCYHANKQCSHLSKSRNLIALLESEALDIGLSACRSCFS
jgi:endonuclease YncB( thermonuclease family)